MPINLDKDDVALIETMTSAARALSVCGQAMTSSADMENELKSTLKNLVQTAVKSVVTIAEVTPQEQSILKALVQDVVHDPRKLNIIIPDDPTQAPLCKSLKSTPRGHCLIINNKDFDRSGCRFGSEHDVKSLTELFEDYLGFSVTCYENLTERETYNKLEKFSKRPDLNTVDSLIVFLMSHGKVTTDNHLHIYSKDEKLIKHEKIIHYFDNFKCPALNECPKMFFFQVCRGSSPDYKTAVQLDNEPTVLEPIPSTSTAPQPERSSEPAKENKALVTLENILKVFPSAPGYSSIRDPAKGSWMIQTLCSVFKENAHQYDVETMLKMVNIKIQKDLADSCISQVLCTESWGFNHKIYFNPPEPE